MIVSLRISSNLYQRHKKFLNFRGDKIDDGLVRIEFTYEKQKPMTQKINYQYGWDYRPSIFNNVITSIDPTWVNNPTFTTSTSLLNCNYNSTTQTKSFNVFRY